MYIYIFDVCKDYKVCNVCNVCNVCKPGLTTPLTQKVQKVFNRSEVVLSPLNKELRTSMIGYMKRCWIMKSNPCYSIRKSYTHLPEEGMSNWGGFMNSEL